MVLTEDERRQAFELLCKYGTVHMSEGMEYFSRLMHAVAYPEESRVTSDTDLFDELEDMFMNYFDCSWEKTKGSWIWYVTDKMIRECCNAYSWPRLAYNLILARNIIHGFAEACEANNGEFSAEELAEHAGDD